MTQAVCEEPTQGVAPHSIFRRLEEIHQLVIDGAASVKFNEEITRLIYQLLDRNHRAEAYALWGEALVADGCWGEAEVAFMAGFGSTQTAYDEPRDHSLIGKLQYGLALVHYALGDLEKARRHCDSGLQELPGADWRYRRLQWLQSELLRLEANPEDTATIMSSNWHKYALGRLLFAR